MCEKADLRITPHSFRIGAATYAATKGIAPQLYRLWGDGNLMLSVVTSGFLHCAFIFIRLVIACLFVCCIHTIPSFKTSHGSLQHFILLLLPGSLCLHTREWVVVVGRVFVRPLLV